MSGSGNEKKQPDTGNESQSDLRETDEVVRLVSDEEISGIHKNTEATISGCVELHEEQSVPAKKSKNSGALDLSLSIKELPSHNVESLILKNEHQRVFEADSDSQNIKESWTDLEKVEVAATSGNRKSIKGKTLEYDELCEKKQGEAAEKCQSSDVLYLPPIEYSSQQNVNLSMVRSEDLSEADSHSQEIRKSQSDVKDEVPKSGFCHQCIENTERKNFEEQSAPTNSTYVLDLSPSKKRTADSRLNVSHSLIESEHDRILQVDNQPQNVTPVDHASEGVNVTASKETGNAEHKGGVSRSSSVINPDFGLAHRTEGENLVQNILLKPMVILQSNQFFYRLHPGTELLLPIQPVLTMPPNNRLIYDPSIAAPHLPTSLPTSIPMTSAAIVQLQSASSAPSMNVEPERSCNPSASDSSRSPQLQSQVGIIFFPDPAFLPMATSRNFQQELQQNLSQPNLSDEENENLDIEENRSVDNSSHSTSNPDFSDETDNPVS